VHSFDKFARVCWNFCSKKFEEIREGRWAGREPPRGMRIVFKRFMRKISCAVVLTTKSKVRLLALAISLCAALGLLVASVASAHLI
jgi:hypothetical protein